MAVDAESQQEGLAISALYRHFSGKDEILDAVVGLIEARFAAFGGGEARRERLFQLLGFFS